MEARHEYHFVADQAIKQRIREANEHRPPSVSPQDRKEFRHLTNPLERPVNLFKKLLAQARSLRFIP